jgi:Xaa-Pro aminopeptidase
MEVTMSEISVKLDLLRNLAVRHNLDAILLQRVSSIAWATCGASTYVNTARSDAEASLLITANTQYLITNNIEAPRLEKEERLASQGWNFHVTAWYDKDAPIQGLVRGLKLGTDEPYPGAEDLSGEIAHLRANLNPREADRFRILGQLCAQAMNTTARAVHPGQTEYEVAGLLAGEAERLGVQVIVNLIAVDERIFNFRHPLPTDKKLNHYIMIVMCGRRWGLVCSLTRLIYFGELPVELRHKEQAVAKVDATLIAATRPGSTLGQIFSIAQEAYADAGYADEWQLHHQGGPAGYEPREYIATPGSNDTVVTGQVYAWNPSITGYKSEDSVLINAGGFEILSTIPAWPTIKVEMVGQIIERPGILIVK